VTQVTLAPAATTPSDPGLVATTIQDLLTQGLPTPSNNYLGLNPTLYTVLLKQTSGLAYFTNGLGNFGWSIGQQLVSGPGGATAGSGGAWFPTPQFATLGLGNLGGGLGHVGGGVAATASQASRIGLLSVPQQWATLTSAVNPATISELEGAEIQTVAATGAPGAPGVPGNAILRGMPPGAMGRRTGTGYINKYGFRYSVLTRPPSAG
jgi:PPE-SVP subfamily C-terminal region